MAWKWQALDGVIAKAPLGGEATGPSPVDRGKQGTKRSGWTGQQGPPLVVQMLARKVAESGKPLLTLDSPANANLLKLGARVLGVDGRTDLLT